MAYWRQKECYCTDPVDDKTMIIHTGFMITDPEFREKLEPHIPEDFHEHFRENLSTVHYYYRESDQATMRSWYRKMHAKGEIIGYARAIYIQDSKRAKIAAIHITVESLHFCLTLVNESSMTPHQLKQMFISGGIGDYRKLPERIQLTMRAYYSHNE